MAARNAKQHTNVIPLQTDPIFAAIERHRAVAATESAHDDEDVDRLSVEDSKVARSLMATVPKTQAGLLALLHYARKLEKRQVISHSNEGLLTALFATVESAIRALPADHAFN